VKKILNMSLSSSPSGDLEHKVYVGPSTLPDAGFGLFAGRDFKKNERITFYGGAKLDLEEANELFLNNKDWRYLRAVEVKHSYIDGFRGIDLFKFSLPDLCASAANDARGPRNNTMYSRQWNEKIAEYQICLKALRDIEKGEEIFVGYGATYWERVSNEQESLNQAAAELYGE
jgi:hypothetical protein